MSREHLIELAGTLQAMRAYLLEQGVCYQLAADALIDVLVQVHRAAKWRDRELRRIGRVGTEIPLAHWEQAFDRVRLDYEMVEAHIHGAARTGCAPVL